MKFNVHLKRDGTTEFIGHYLDTILTTNGLTVIYVSQGGEILEIPASMVVLLQY